MKQLKDNYAVILAGGSGTRFWPLSRRDKPKQFLDVAGTDTLLSLTIKRVLPVFPVENILIVTGKNFAEDVSKEAKKFRIQSENILLEPSGKNTAPAIAWAASRIHSINPQARMAVLPSDHLILKEKKFLLAIGQAFHAAQKNYLVTLGIVPTRPEIGYGYLRIKNSKINNQKWYDVQQFVEKPSFNVAKRFLKNGNYWWNSGMFFWKTETILQAFRKHQFDIFNVIEEINQDPRRLNELWSKLPSISIDYGILEKSDKVAAIPAKDIGWSDLGSWESLFEILPKDKLQNVFKGDVIALNSQNNLVWGKKKLVVVIGVNNLIAVDTEDALLICRKDLSQTVKGVVAHLEHLKRKEI